MNPVISSENPVTLCIGKMAYHRELPQAVHAAGMRCRVVRQAPDYDVRDVQDGDSFQNIRRFPFLRVADRVLWTAWRRMPKGNRFPLFFMPALVGRRIAACVLPNGIFHGMTNLSLETLLGASRHRCVSVIEHPMHHPDHWHKELLQECRTFGISPRHCGLMLPRNVVARMTREYELCDRILVCSTLAKRNFDNLGLGQKATVVLIGIDHEHFVPSSAPPPRFRVLFAGRVELGKGIPYLLQAWKRLALNGAELILVGEVQPDMRQLLAAYANDSVRVTGPVSADQVARHMREAAVVVVPSVNDSLPRVTLEAMSCALPVIATDLSGAEDCVVDGKTGVLVPARDPDALADALLWCHQHPDEARALGLAARQAVLDNFTIRHYQQRQLALYRSLVARPGLSVDSRPVVTASAGTSLARVNYPA